ncbi:MAG: hypothetical protein AAF607_05220 [Pseudomonadota bacterium]
MPTKSKIVEIILTVFVAFVFVQSLFFKFAGAPETVHIFGTLDRWAAGLTGIEGLFNPGGIFSANVVGSTELVASLLLLAGLILKKPILQLFGALLGLGVIAGAIVFHLFTPLGVVIENPELGVESDGGTLFVMAVAVFVSCAVLSWRKKSALPFAR